MNTNGAVTAAGRGGGGPAPGHVGSVEEMGFWQALSPGLHGGTWHVACGEDWLKSAKLAGKEGCQGSEPQRGTPSRALAEVGTAAVGPTY